MDDLKKATDIEIMAEIAKTQDSIMAMQRHHGTLTKELSGRVDKFNQEELKKRIAKKAEPQNTGTKKK